MASPRLTEIGARPERSMTPIGDVERAAVLEHLEHILASSAFRNSRRYCGLLRHVVQRSLDGRVDDLKERTIGVEVFGRTPDYDTNADHIVRSVAGDVRRRLAQYYMENGSDQGVRIELAVGSYVPQFRFPTAAAEPLVSEVTTVLIPEPAVAEPAAPAVVPPKTLGPRTLAIGAVAVLAVAAVLAGKWAGPQSAFDQFWGPVLGSNVPVMLSVGGGNGDQPAPADRPLTMREFDSQPSRRMHVSDALALAQVTGLLQSHQKPFRILNRANSVSFRELQSAPFVLIGGMNNSWTLRVTDSLRYRFDRVEGGGRVMDTKDPSQTAWKFDANVPVTQVNRDYAIVSRLRDVKTEQIAVIAAGIGSWGTLAAGEFVTNPEHLKKLERFIGRDWARKNLQAVIATDVIQGSSGPPMVLAAYTW